MPFIDIDTNITLSEEQKRALLHRAAEYISTLPGKRQERTMVEISDKKTMLFNGSDDPCMKIRVELYQHSDLSSKESFGKKLTDLVSCIAGLDPERVYITYPEYDHWGSGGILKSDPMF